MESEKALDGLDPFLDMSEGYSNIAPTQGDGGFGARVHHGEVGAILLQFPLVVFTRGILPYQVEDAQVSGSVPFSSFEVLDCEEAEITIVVLDSLHLQLGTVVAVEGEAGIRSFFLLMFHEPVEMVFEEGFAFIGCFAVRSPIGFHLNEAEVQPHLHLWPSILAGDFPRVDARDVVLPLLKDLADVRIQFCFLLSE